MIVYSVAQDSGYFYQDVDDIVELIVSHVRNVVYTYYIHYHYY